MSPHAQAVLEWGTLILLLICAAIVGFDKFARCREKRAMRIRDAKLRKFGMAPWPRPSSSRDCYRDRAGLTK